jgi:ABC-type branched-subunit amino acid transport system substrate-binding protein
MRPTKKPTVLIRALFDNAYSAAIALLNAIEKAGSTDYDAIQRAADQ